jgi:hypothetical protein
MVVSFIGEGYWYLIVYALFLFSQVFWGRRGRVHVCTIVRFTSTYAISAYHHWCWVRISTRTSWTTLCDKVCQWLVQLPYDHGHDGSLLYGQYLVVTQDCFFLCNANKDPERSFVGTLYIKINQMVQIFCIRGQRRSSVWLENLNNWLYSGFH